MWQEQYLFFVPCIRNIWIKKKIYTMRQTRVTKIFILLIDCLSGQFAGYFWLPADMARIAYLKLWWLNYIFIREGSLELTWIDIFNEIILNFSFLIDSTLILENHYCYYYDSDQQTDKTKNKFIFLNLLFTYMPSS